MIKFGINTFLWGAAFKPADYARLCGIKSAGFDGIEVPILDPLDFDAAGIRRELAKHDLECTAVTICPGGLSLGSSDETVRKAARRHFEACISAACDAGAKMLSGPMYTPVGHLTGVRRTSDEWKWGVDSWQHLGDAVRDADIEVGIEPLNRFETYFLNTVSDAVQFCRQIDEPRIGLLFDTFHANIEEKSVGASLRQAAPYLKHLHTCENDRGIPGSGHVAWEEFFTAVEDINYDGWMTIESFGFSLGAMSAAASVWRDLAKTPDAIAFDGLAFLRENVLKARAV